MCFRLVYVLVCVTQSIKNANFGFCISDISKSNLICSLTMENFQRPGMMENAFIGLSSMIKNANIFFPVKFLQFERMLDYIHVEFVF